MKKLKLVQLSLILSLILMVFGSITIQSNGVVLSSLPFKDEGSFTGFSYVAVSDQVDTKFHALTELSKIYNSPIANLKLERNDINVDLSGTNVISDIVGVRDYINPIIANNTWNTATSAETNTSAVNPTFTTPAASSKDTEFAFSVTTGSDVAASVSQTTITAITELSEDLDGDGVFEETGLGEKDHWRNIDENTMLYFSIGAIDMTANTGNASLKFVFETTAANDYNISVVLHTGSGDTGWTGLTSSADDGATWNFYDIVTGVHLAQMIPMDELLTDDLGDSTAIQGLTRLELKLTVTENDTTDMEIQVRNIAFFTQGDLVGVTDNQDGDDDFDFNDANGIPANSQDDTDLLITEVTELAVDTYDFLVPLESTIFNGDELSTEFRKLEFTGVATLIASDVEVTSQLTEGAFLITSTLVFRTTELKDITTASRLPTWTNLFHNMTVENDFLIDTSDSDLNFQFYEIDDVDELDSFGSVWIGVSDADVIQFDIADPSASDGAKQDIIYSWTSPVEIEFVAAVDGVAVVAEEGALSSFFQSLIRLLEDIPLIGGILIAALGVVGIRKAMNSNNK